MPRITKAAKELLNRLQQYPAGYTHLLAPEDRKAAEILRRAGLVQTAHMVADHWEVRLIAR